MCRWTPRVAVLAVLLPLLNRKGTREGNGEEREREREGEMEGGDGWVGGGAPTPLKRQSLTPRRLDVLIVLISLDDPHDGCDGCAFSVS